MLYNIYIGIYPHIVIYCGISKSGYSRTTHPPAVDFPGTVMFKISHLSLHHWAFHDLYGFASLISEFLPTNFPRKNRFPFKENVSPVPGIKPN